MQNDNDLNAADHERETRAIGQLIRNFEKVCDLENGARDGSRQKQDSKPDLKAELGELDPHSLREELAQRIIQLCEKQPDSS